MRRMDVEDKRRSAAVQTAGSWSDKRTGSYTQAGCDQFALEIEEVGAGGQEGLHSRPRQRWCWSRRS